MNTKLTRKQATAFLNKVFSKKEQAEWKRDAKRRKDIPHFSYCIACPGENGYIGAYTYGSQVFHGTLEDAEAMLKYVREQALLASGTRAERKRHAEQYKIYRLVPHE